MTDISFCDRRLSGTPVHSAITAAICFLSTCGETSNWSLCRASSSAVSCASRCTGETVSAVSSGCTLPASSADSASVLSCSASGGVSSTASASGNDATSSSATPSNCWRSAIISCTSVCCCQATSSSSSADSVSSYCSNTSVIREVSVRSPMRSSRSSWRISASCWWLRVVSAEICFGGDDRLMATRAQAVSSTSMALSGN
ncbi:hypothetical protein HmCmsJML016_01354 [Escherichia coli]|nr:hypothetical protein ExPCM1_00012 [Escherichia coli]GCO14723.1 hypothetical protein ExPCM12_04434 [Escherichia coli]GCO67362.1 hypothetical protein ExPCM32_04224 [Escherichia coli]GCS79386.1 hypothetical protein HmCmsJML016_01354 [Escherichia coli]GDV81867.1 hypothetical protein ExPUPEC91_04588 [Escherichia coli]